MFSISKGKTGNKALEKSLHSQQRRFEKMFFEAPVSMCVLKGKEHVFVSANDQYYKLTGRENIIGKTVREVFPEVEGQGYFDWLDKVYQTGETFSSAESPLKLTLPDGRVKWAYLNFMYQPYTDSEERIEGIFYFGVDVTEQVVARKKIENSRKQYRDLIQNLPAAVYTVDSCGRIVLFNKAAIELWGREPEIGKELWCGSSEIYHADGTPVSKDRSPIAISVREGRSVRGAEVILKRMDWEFRNIVPHSSPIIDAKGKITGGINVMLDITKRKRAEEELKNAFEKLSRSENEIRLFAKQLNDVLEGERSRIAREIHDEFGQQLVGLKMLLSSLDKIIGFDAGAKYIVDEMMRGLDSTSLSLQNFSTELRPGILDTLGLIPSIEWLPKDFEHKAGIPSDLEIRTAHPTL